jgi:SAM-dependent methyltransferase
MLARKGMPRQFVEWNRRWGAPRGRERIWHRIGARISPRSLRPFVVGPFGFQPDNSETRRYEYPWAYHATALWPGQKALDVGGSLSGLQFVLAKAGLSVINVDPSDAAVRGWPLDASTFETLNRAFGTDVELRRTFLEEARLPSSSIDRVFAISTLEHVPDDGIARLISEVRRILRPGGSCVLTIDLFLDLKPFTDRETNDSGHNVDIAWLVEESRLNHTQGDRRELYGFPEFDPRQVLAGLSEYLYDSQVPALAQTLVLEKPAP